MSIKQTINVELILLFKKQLNTCPAIYQTNSSFRLKTNATRKSNDKLITINSSKISTQNLIDLFKET